jgi:uncharacterized repeat protein (TIGR01451 family)
LASAASFTTTRPFTLTTVGRRHHKDLRQHCAPGGGYTVSENVPAGWVLTGSSCTNGTPTNITVAGGATTTCTFTNTVGLCHATPNNGATVFASLDAHAVQQAVDAAAAGGTVKVAGSCVGVESRASTTQSAYISKTLTLSGGYTTTNWATSHSITQPTVIDANSGGRVLFATMALTVSNITLQRGNIGGSGITCPDAGCGGGVWAQGALTLSNVQVLSNTASNGGGARAGGAVMATNSRFENNSSTVGAGGGLYTASTLWLTDTHFISNMASIGGGGARAGDAVMATNSRFENNRSTNWYGGGLYAVSTLWLTNTHFISNTASSVGGGTFAGGAATAVNSRFENNSSTGSYAGGLHANSTLWLTNTHFISNTASIGGGGAFAIGAMTAANSRFENNRSTGGNGGGLYAQSTLLLTNTLFLRNRAGTNGGGLYLYGSVTATERLVNVLMAGNQANGAGNAIYANHDGGDDTLTILHTTIASPTLTGGSAIYVNAGTAVITDTIIVNHATGIQRNGGTVTQDYNLFFSNTANTGGTVGGGSHSVIGNPAFVNPAADDYRLTASSAAINIGANVGVTSDFFGDPRPQGGGFDVGYDESPYTPIVASCYATHNNGTAIFSSLDAHAVQQAVDAAAAGGHVKVAGKCVGVESRAGTNQSAYISKRLTLSGGYTTTNWATSHPITQPTVIDANSGGRVLRIVGVPVEIVSLMLQGGQITGEGAGVHSTGALTLTNVSVLSNTALLDGGGVYAGGAVAAANSHFENNLSTNYTGGGLYANSTLWLTNTHFISNTASGNGGGVRAADVARVLNSRFENNRSIDSDGGGLSAISTLWLTNTHFLHNRAAINGGGIYLYGVGASSEHLVNVLLAGNRANGEGQAIYAFHNGSNRLTILHSTISSPTLTGGAAVVVAEGTAVISDTIITNHAIGIQRNGGTVSQDYNLFYANGVNTDGTVSGGTNSVVGSPGFVNPAADDYRLTATSAAINIGANVGVTCDFFGDPRPQGGGFDAGYDETAYTTDVGIAKAVTPALVTPGGAITYTLRISNTGTGLLNAIVVSDSIPFSVTVTGIASSTVGSGVVINQTSAAPNLAWTINKLAVGERAVITITGMVTASPAISLPGQIITNTAIITARNDITVSNNSASAAPYRLCGPGTYLNTATNQCVAAPPGYFTPGFGYTQALACDPGTYQPNAGQSACLLAPVNSYVPVSGSVAPTPCPAGTYNPLQGASSVTACLSANMGITKTVAPASAAAGAAITYTIRFSNAGPGLAHSVTLSDRVPVSVTVSSVASSTVGGGVFITQTSGSPNFAWNVSDLAVGAGGVITLTGTVSPALTSGGLITNTATITASNDITTSNNRASALLALRYPLTVSLNGTGSGSVNSNPPGVACGGDCSESYLYNTVVTLTATADAGSTFTGWSGGSCAGTGTCSVTMNTTRSVTATFTLNSYLLTVAKSGTGSGSVNSSPVGVNCGVDCSESYLHGTVVTLTATATCTFTNTRQFVQDIVIVKQSVPQSSTNFRFTGSYLGGGSGSDSGSSIADFYLDDAAPNDGDAYGSSKSFTVPRGAVYSFASRRSAAGIWHPSLHAARLGHGQPGDAQRDDRHQQRLRCHLHLPQREGGRVDGAQVSREQRRQPASRRRRHSLSTWTIQVKTPSPTNTLVSQAATNALGKVSFSLKPGSYQVCEVMKSGWTQKVPNPAVNACHALTLLPGSATQVDFGNCPNSSCPAMAAEVGGADAPVEPVTFTVAVDDLDGWVEQWLLTPDGPVEETMEPDAGEEEDAGLRVFLPVVVK